MKPLITGAAGFIGSNLCNWLHEHNIPFVAVDNLSFGKRESLHSDIELVEKDFINISQEDIDNWGCDMLIHLATSNIIYAVNHPAETFINNAIKSRYLFSCFPGNKIIYTSTASVYGQADLFPTPEDATKKPYNAYDSSKLVAEYYLQDRMNYTTLRLSNVYGPGQSPVNPYCGVLGKFIALFKMGRPFRVFGEGKATRDYTHVDDVVRAIYIAMQTPALDTEVNIATGIETSVEELMHLVAGDSPDKTHYAERDIDRITRRCLSIEKAERLLGWQPVISIKAGIASTIESFSHD